MHKESDFHIRKLTFLKYSLELFMEADMMRHVLTSSFALLTSYSLK